MTYKKPLIIAASAPFDEAAAVFKKGGIIAYPTETFYGLAVDPFNPRAVDKLFALKGRSEKNPVSVIIKDAGMLEEVAAETPPLALMLIEKFWPGPLTIVFKASSGIPPRLIANTGKIGVRVPGSRIARRLSEALSSPITATSANPSGLKPPVEAKEVLDYFNGRVDILIDGGRLPGLKGSTVVDITSGIVEIIRDGEISKEAVFEAMENPPDR